MGTLFVTTHHGVGINLSRTDLPPKHDVKKHSRRQVGTKRKSGARKPKVFLAIIENALEFVCVYVCAI